jgi:hypothetical protein
MRARTISALIGLCFGASACGSAPPPELRGIWSSSQMACAAGVGIRFQSDAIQAIYDRQIETLFEHPQYEVRGRGPFRVRIVYDLPHVAGAAQVAGARGVVELTRRQDGSIAPTLHNLLDARTGAARIQLVNDPAIAALTLTSCLPGRWRADLRERS